MSEALNPERSNKTVDHVYHAWDRALAANDVEALLALYADDATIESPINGKCGVSRGVEIFSMKLSVAVIKRG